jgi:hypothetical protein
VSLSAAALEGMVAALEADLVAHPDDPARHAALADVLIGRGDSRGKFMQAQLALEDPGTPPAQRPGYRERERKLLKKHLQEWLGELAGFLLDDRGKVEAHRLRFERGWLETLRLPRWSVGVARCLVRAPQTRLLRQLEIDASGAEQDALSVLLDAPFLARLRCFRLGAEPDETDGPHAPASDEAVDALVARMPRLEELYLGAVRVAAGPLFGLTSLGHLRILQVDFLGEHPAEALAANAALGRLTHLLLHADRKNALRPEHLQAIVRSPHLTSLRHLRWRGCADDDACATLAQGDFLGRLRTLDLRRGTVTDAGARRLAACAHVGRLEALDLSDNALTPDGVAVLRATGVRLRVDGLRELSP